MSTTGQRRQVQEAAVDATNLPDVAAVSVVPAAKEPTDRWTLDLVCHDRGRGVPPAVCALLADHELAVRSVGSQGTEQRQVLAVA